MYVYVYIYIYRAIVFGVEKNGRKESGIIFSVIVPRGWLEIFEVFYFFVE